MSHIAVIGAGITGVTTAYALRVRGHEVTVFDQHRYAGMETSFANGGQLSASNAEVWNKTSTVIQGSGTRQDIQFAMLGPDLNELQRYATAIKTLATVV